MSRKQFRGQQEQPKSGLDISSLLSDRNSANSNRVSSDNAIPEFKQILEVADSVEVILDATKQFGDIIIRWITDSLGSSKYDQAVEAIRIMKEECVSVEEPSAYNDFMLDLKSRLLKKELQGDRQEMWWKIRVSKLGLIEKKMSLSSNVSEEEARKVRRLLLGPHRRRLIFSPSFYLQVSIKCQYGTLSFFLPALNEGLKTLHRRLRNHGMQTYTVLYYL